MDGDHERVELRLLGGFGLSVAATPVALPAGARRLVAFLALERRWVTRAELADTLWPVASARRASGNLRSTLWRLSRFAGRSVCAARAHSIRLDSTVEVDWAVVTAGLRSIHTTPPVEALTSDVLPDWPDDWVAVHRECFRQLRLRALEALCAHRRDSGRLGEALEAGLTAVAADPLRESAHRELFAVHLAQGNAAEALRQYHLYRDMLRSRLGLTPSPVMRDMVAPLLCRTAR